MKPNTAQREHYKAGKSFVLMFNRVSMYGPGHPFSVQAVEDFYQSIQGVLKHTSPVVLIYAQDQFFLEDEPLDRSLNYFKMSSHFKKADVSSISIQRELGKSELAEFVNIFLDTRAHPTAEEMRRAAAARGVVHIRINHVFFQKVTEDDEIVSRSVVERSETLGGQLESARQYQEALGMIAGKLMLEEIDQSLSLQALLADPVGFSQAMLAREQAVRQGPDGDLRAQGYSITGHLSALGSQVRQSLSDGSRLALPELAEALVKMKGELSREIDARKSLGTLMEEGESIREQAESLTDAVVLELARQEYDKGRATVERLAFVLRRLIPAAEDLRRVLPRLRDCLLAEGMPPADFARLIRQLADDRQNDEVLRLLREGAGDMGVEEGDLVGAIKADPAGISRFLYLAGEIEKASGSPQPLCDIMVDVLERLGTRILGQNVRTDACAGDEKLRRWVLLFQSGIVAELKAGGAGSELVQEVEKRLQARLDQSVAAIRAELSEYQASLKANGRREQSLLEVLEGGLPGAGGLREVLRQVRARCEERGLDQNDFEKLLELIREVREEAGRGEKPLEDILFNQETTLKLLKIEASRSMRYGTGLSAIGFSVLKSGLRQAAAGQKGDRLAEVTAILNRMRERLRTTDWLGMLGQGVFLAVLPMTRPREAHLTSRRLLKALNADPAARLKVAGAVAHYDPRKMADAEAFVRCVRSEHVEMVHRLRNLQHFM
jgi:hypothetical protein